MGFLVCHNKKNIYIQTFSLNDVKHFGENGLTNHHVQTKTAALHCVVGPSQIKTYAARAGLLWKSCGEECLFLADMKGRHATQTVPSTAKCMHHHRHPHQFHQNTQIYTLQPDWHLKGLALMLLHLWPLRLFQFLMHLKGCSRNPYKLKLPVSCRSLVAHQPCVQNILWCLLGSKMWTCTTGIHQISIIAAKYNETQATFASLTSEKYKLMTLESREALSLVWCYVDGCVKKTADFPKMTQLVPDAVSGQWARRVFSLKILVFGKEIYFK